MLDRQLSREQFNRSSRIADRIRGYIQDAVMFLDREEREQVFWMLASKMGIKTEAHAVLDRILSSKKEKEKWTN